VEDISLEGLPGKAAGFHFHIKLFEKGLFRREPSLRVEVAQIIDHKFLERHVAHLLEPRGLGS